MGVAVRGSASLAHDDLTGGEQRPEQHGRGLGVGQDGLGLDAAPELLVQPLDGVGNRYEMGGADVRPWRLGREPKVRAGRSVP